MHEYTNMNSNLREYILGVHHELSQNLESKIFRRFLTDNFDIKARQLHKLNNFRLRATENFQTRTESEQKSCHSKAGRQMM